MPERATSGPDWPSPAAPPEPSGTGGARRLWPWLVLAAILLAYALTILGLRPAANFGGLQDDATYFALGKALATGRGYILLSFPGGLTRLKFPELYPWLLSWVWRWDPRFPGNVPDAIGLTVVFAGWFLLACFLLAKRTLGLGPVWALGVTALCGFNYFALLLGGSVLSDLPFAALALTAALAADRGLAPQASGGRSFSSDKKLAKMKGLQPQKHVPGSFAIASTDPVTRCPIAWMALAGVLAAMATGLRTVGVTVIAGIALVALLRRRYRAAIVLGVVGGCLALPWILPPIVHALAPRPRAGPEALGWSETLAFYSSYIGQWRHYVPNAATQQAVLLKNALSVFLEPGILLLYPLASRSAAVSVLAGSALALLAWVGIVLGLRRAGLKAIHGLALVYLAMVLPWPFPPERFLVPVLPLLVGGMVLVFREALRRAALALRGNQPLVERAGAFGLGAALLVLAAVVAANCAYFAPASLAKLMSEQRTALVGKRKAYAWIAGNTPPEARFIAYDDVLLYLYTGRQAIRPIAPSTASAYDNDLGIARLDAAHLGDVAREVDAAYWLVTPTDFSKEMGQDPVILARAQNQLLAGLPVVLSADSGRIRIYDLKGKNQFHAKPPSRKGAKG